MKVPSVLLAVAITCLFFAPSQAQSYAQLTVYPDSACSTSPFAWIIAQVGVCVSNSTGDETSLKVTSDASQYTRTDYLDSECLNVDTSQSFPVGKCTAEASTGAFYAVANSASSDFPTGPSGLVAVETYYGGTCAEPGGTTVIGRSVFSTECVDVLFFSTQTTCNSTHITQQFYLGTGCPSSGLQDYDAFPLGCVNNTVYECHGGSSITTPYGAIVLACFIFAAFGVLF